MTLRMGMVVGVLLGVTEWASAAEGTVERWGEAQVSDGNRVQAKKEATNDALRKCIEYVVGVEVQSGMNQVMQETVRNNQSTFYAKVRDEMVTRADGFVERYDVVEEQVQDDVVRVRVRARVYESKIKAQVKKLADLIRAAGNPKLMLVVQEVVIDPDGDRTVQGTSIMGAYLEKALIERGFELRGQGSARGQARTDEAAYEAWLSDVAAVSEMARAQGADIVIAGQVEINDLGVIEDTAGLSALQGQTRVEIKSVVRGVNAATSEVFSSKPIQTSSIGINQERAVHRAFRGRGKNLVKQTFDDLLTDLKASFEKTARQGQQYVVAVTNLRSFRSQGRSFLKLLTALEGVGQVQQKSFFKGRLTVNVNCTCSSVELQNRIFQATENDATFDKLDVAGVSGKRLTFRL